jgi:hypothetical protein
VKCYIHASGGSSEEAVAICIICGMGVCLEHAVERDLPVHRPAGLAGYPERAMLILCQRDAQVHPVG